MKKSPFFTEKNGFFDKNARFSKLVSFYARRLMYYEAETDLWEFLYELETTRKVPSDRYIAVCLRNEYIRLNKERQRQRVCEAPLFPDVSSVDFDIETALDVREALRDLTPRQKVVIGLRYHYGFSDIEIAKILGISRESVYRLRDRGFKKMRSKIIQG